MGAVQFKAKPNHEREDNPEVKPDPSLAVNQSQAASLAASHKRSQLPILVAEPKSDPEPDRNEKTKSDLAVTQSQVWPLFTS